MQKENPDLDNYWKLENQNRLCQNNYKIDLLFAYSGKLKYMGILEAGPKGGV